MKERKLTGQEGEGGRGRHESSGRPRRILRERDRTRGVKEDGTKEEGDKARGNP